MSECYFVLFIMLILSSITHQKTKDEWKSRTIYQVLTDRYRLYGMKIICRFEKGDGSKGDCDLISYCGGNYKGLQNRLDYIQDLGFNAIWISPIVDNYDRGYHGYWARRIYDLNLNFGTKEDLINFIQECHRRDIWVMFDIVANHMGNRDEDYSQNYPFTEIEHYHEYCEITQEDFETYNTFKIQFCRFAGHADLNSENPYVQEELFRWIKFLVEEYDVDGFRIDTAVQVPNFFWSLFSQAAGVFTMGEASNINKKYVGQYVGPFDTVLNYPLFYKLRDVFTWHLDMSELKTYYDGWIEAIGIENLEYLGNFNDNHDLARFMNEQIGDNFYEVKIKQFKSITAFCLTSVGIPIIYYGSEQGFTGGHEPLNREIMWNSFERPHEMKDLIQKINKARKLTQSQNYPQIERFVDHDVYAFSRGQLFVALSSKQNKVVIRTINYHPYNENDVLCNIFWESDCVQVINGKFDLYLNFGEVKIFTLSQQEDQTQLQKYQNISTIQLQSQQIVQLCQSLTESIVNDMDLFKF